MVEYSPMMTNEDVTPKSPLRVWPTKAVSDPFLPVAFTVAGAISTFLGGFVLFGVKRIKRYVKKG